MVNKKREKKKKKKLKIVTEGGKNNPVKIQGHRREKDQREKEGREIKRRVK